MLPSLHFSHGNTGFYSQFLLGEVSFDAFKQEVITRCFEVDWYQLPGAESLGMAKFGHNRSMCNTQQLTQRPLPLEFWIEP